MPTFRDPAANFTFETVLAFLAALLVFPLVIRAIWVILRGVFRLGFVRKLLVQSLIVGATSLLTKEGVLDKLFGQKGRQGDGLLKPPAGH